MAELARLPQLFRPRALHCVPHGSLLGPAWEVIPGHALLAALVPQSANLIRPDIEHAAVDRHLQALAGELLAEEVLCGFGVRADAFEGEGPDDAVASFGELEHDVSMRRAIPSDDLQREARKSDYEAKAKLRIPSE